MSGTKLRWIWRPSASSASIRWMFASDRPASAARAPSSASDSMIAPAAAATLSTIATSSARPIVPRPSTRPTTASPATISRRAVTARAPETDPPRPTIRPSASWIEIATPPPATPIRLDDRPEPAVRPIGIHRDVRDRPQNAAIPAARSGWTTNRRSSPVRWRTRSTPGCGPDELDLGLGRVARRVQAQRVERAPARLRVERRLAAHDPDDRAQGDEAGAGEDRSGSSGRAGGGGCRRRRDRGPRRPGLEIGRIRAPRRAPRTVTGTDPWTVSTDVRSAIRTSSCPTRCRARLMVSMLPPPGRGR